MAEFSFHHGGVSVPDIAEALDWYDRVLGFKLESQFYIEQAKSKAAMIRKGPLRFELFEAEDAASMSDDRRHPPLDILTHGNKHVAFQVVDVEVFLEEMTAKGADIALVVREAFGKGCFLRDCAGNLIEFVEVQNAS